MFSSTHKFSICSQNSLNFTYLKNYVFNIRFCYDIMQRIYIIWNKMVLNMSMTFYEGDRYINPRRRKKSRENASTIIKKGGGREREKAHLSHHRDHLSSIVWSNSFQHIICSFILLYANYIHVHIAKCKHVYGAQWALFCCSIVYITIN